MKSLLLAFVGLSVLQYANALGYYKAEVIQGGDWLNQFSWQAVPDPTHGRTHYVDQSTAAQNGIFTFWGQNFVLRADSQHVVQPSEAGRMSFRLASNNEYNHHVAIFDIVHMPEGCGTWPAVWYVSRYASSGALTQLHLVSVMQQVGDNWPNNGEIDILEGANNHAPNLVSLHTGPNCQMPQYRYMTGSSTSNDCDVYSNGNQGCGVQFADSFSFGPNFNKNGGGWYAVERARNYIAVYFWERTNPYVPAEVRNRGGTVDPSTWGVPAAFFVDWECDIPSHFGPMRIIINLAFCGDLAGSTFSANGCPGSCADYVNNNPWAFGNAFFEFTYLDIYFSESG